MLIKNLNTTAVILPLVGKFYFVHCSILSLHHVHDQRHKPRDPDPLYPMPQETITTAAKNTKAINNHFSEYEAYA